MIINKKLQTITLKYIKISSKKLNKKINILKGKTYFELLKYFQYSHNKVDILIWKLLYSLINNIEQKFKINKINLILLEAYNTRGPILKKIQACAKGQAIKIQKKYSHLTFSFSLIKNI